MGVSIFIPFDIDRDVAYPVTVVVYQCGVFGDAFSAEVQCEVKVVGASRGVHIIIDIFFKHLVVTVLIEKVNDAVSFRIQCGHCRAFRETADFVSCFVG